MEEKIANVEAANNLGPIVDSMSILPRPFGSLCANDNANDADNTSGNRVTVIDLGTVVGMVLSLYPLITELAGHYCQPWIELQL